MLQGIVDVLKSTDSQVELLASVPVNESLANPATGDQLDVANIVNLVTIPLVVRKHHSALKLTLT